MREIIKYTSVTDQLVRQSLQECIDQFIGTKLTPVTLSMLDQVIKQYVEGVRDPVQHCGQHVKLDQSLLEKLANGRLKTFQGPMSLLMRGPTLVKIMVYFVRIRLVSF